MLSAVSSASMGVRWRSSRRYPQAAASESIGAATPTSRHGYWICMNSVENGLRRLHALAHGNSGVAHASSSAPSKSSAAHRRSSRPAARSPPAYRRTASSAQPTSSESPGTTPTE